MELENQEQPKPKPQDDDIATFEELVNQAPSRKGTPSKLDKIEEADGEHITDESGSPKSSSDETKK